jgi:tetratricopeptide (TPR) repeat protein
MRIFSLFALLSFFLVLHSCGNPAEKSTKESSSTDSAAVFSGTKPSADVPDDGTDKAKAYQLFQQGTNEMKEQRYQDAVKTFLSAMEYDPENYRIYYNLGSCYYSLKEYSLVLSYFGDAVSFNPNDTSALIYSGMIHYLEGRIEESITYYNQAIDINNQLYMAWYNRGTSYGRLEEYDKAIFDFSEAIRINPVHGNSYMNRGLAYLYKGETDLACKDWKKASAYGVSMADEAIRQHCP